MKKMHVRRDDTVIVISGDDKGVKGKVIAVSPEEGKVIVEGANIVSKHQKPRRQGCVKEQETPAFASVCFVIPMTALMQRDTTTA